MANTLLRCLGTAWFVCVCVLHINLLSGLKHTYCLKKTQNAPRPSEHPPVRGKKRPVVVVVVYLTLTDPLRIQPWSQDSCIAINAVCQSGTRSAGQGHIRGTTSRQF